jgi:hypothetical protein
LGFARFWVLEFWVLAIGFCKILGFAVLSYVFEQLGSTGFWILGFWILGLRLWVRVKQIVADGCYNC